MKTVEEILAAQVEDLTARLNASEKLRNDELARHESRESEFFETQQDLVHTILLLKGIPIRERDENGELVELKPTPSKQRKTWHQIVTGMSLQSIKRAEDARRLRAQQQPAVPSPASAGER